MRLFRRIGGLGTGACLMLGMVTASPAHAMMPEFVSGMLLLKADDTMSRTHTGYTAIVAGVATWYYKNRSAIEAHCWTYKKIPFAATLAYYGFTDVTTAKLASLISLDSTLGLQYVSQDVVNLVKAALDADRAATTYPMAVGSYWDPFNVWKWRSVYMENRVAENGIDQEINANCHGTSNYLTRSFEWAEAYPLYESLALNSGNFDAWGATFPHIYLDGYPFLGNAYSIDRDVLENQWRLHLRRHGPRSVNIPIHRYINSFDFLRLSDSELEFAPSLVLDGVNLKVTRHSMAYLCTDATGRHWFFEKGNFGNATTAPYGIRALGANSGWQYESAYRSLFSHDDDFKQNVASSLEENWYGLAI